jgi:hypothetical protein
MEISYKIEHRDVKYPRLEFKTTTLLIILPREIKDATEILEKRKTWIQKKWKIIQEAIKNTNTQQGFLIFGKPFQIENTTAKTPKINFSERKIEINTQNPKHRKIIKQTLKNLLLHKITPLIKEYSQKIGVKPNKITIRQQKTKWGSCSQKRNISFNLKLICLPENLTKYVIYHETLHLKQRKHNQLFWEKIKQEFPNYKNLEKKLLQYWFRTEILSQNLGIKTNKDFK